MIFCQILILTVTINYARVGRCELYKYFVCIPRSIKPQSHRIVRFLDRTIGCDSAKMRPIGNVCYDLQQRSHTAIDLYDLVALSQGSYSFWHFKFHDFS